MNTIKFKTKLTALFSMIALASTAYADHNEDIRVIINGKTYTCSEGENAGSDYFTCKAECHRGMFYHTMNPRSGTKGEVIKQFISECQSQGGSIQNVKCEAL